MAFNWFTNSGIDGGKVQIIEGIISDSSLFSNPNFSFNANCTQHNNLNYCVASNSLNILAGIADNTKKSYNSNKALAKGLTPNTSYSFRVGKNGAWSEIGTFTTAKQTKEEFSFIYFTDPQANGDYYFDVSQKTTHKAQEMYPNVNFWLSCGDLVENLGLNNSEWEMEQFFETQQDIFINNPFTVVGGNHDNSSNKNFAAHFYTDSTNFEYQLSQSPGSVYSFVYGDALFMALSYEYYYIDGYLDSLSAWMTKQVEDNPTVKWKIAFFHKTMFTGSKNHQSDYEQVVIRDKMAPLFDSLQINLAIQGHDHVYEVIGPVFNKELVLGAVSNQISVPYDSTENITGKMFGTFNTQNGTIYFLNNSAGKKKYEPRTEAEMISAQSSLGITDYFSLFSGRYGQTGLPTFSYVTINTDTISIKTYEVDDFGNANLFDSFKIVKNNLLTSHESNFQTFINVLVNERNKLTIKLKTPISTKIQIFSIDGKLVKTTEINFDTNISIDELAKGIYILKASSINNEYTTKFLKQ
jgi:UDP-2,3-diacylglucosamine pyrophosphatase LpxH